MIPTDLNYDYENCRCGHNGLNHGLRDAAGGYRCTVPGCGCALFTPTLSPEEIQARNEVLRSKAREFVEAKKEPPGPNDDPEAVFVQGPYRSEIRKTFDCARPILEKLSQQIPSLDRTLILGCLAEQTRIAMKWPTREYRKTVLAWKKFCKAWDEFCSAALQTPTLEQLKDTLKTQKKLGVRLNREPEEMYSELYKKWPPWLEKLREALNLPMPEAKGKRGRPEMWWIDLQAQKLEDYFREQTGYPQREIVGDLLSCAPVPKGVSIDTERIRQRKRRRSKKDRHMMRLAAGKRG